MYQIPFTNIAAWSELKAPPGVMGKIAAKNLGSLVHMDKNITTYVIILQPIFQPTYQATFIATFSERQSEVY